jgi:two-component system NtrC family sensor kinase
LKKLQGLFAAVERGKFMWEATFDAIRDPVVIIGKDYRILRANLAAARRSEKRIHDLVGKRCYESFAGRDDACPDCPLQATLDLRRPHAVEITGMIRGSDFHVASYPMARGAIGKGPVAVHHYHDVTKEKNLQRKLIQSEKMGVIGMLAGGVAHEINNPLAGILAFTQILRRELAGKTEAVNDLNEIEEAAKRCKKIVEDLLTFARPGSGDFHDISVGETIDKILPLAKLNLRHRGVDLEKDYSDVPRIRGNSARLQQVFLNLINNAAQAMSSGGVVTVRIKKSSHRQKFLGDVFVEIEDRGSGIRKEDLGKIFDPFYTTKAREGTGLGLSICYSIIEEHGGKIEVESEWGRGSLFRVVLPVIS